jgi:hypothetical protein
MIGLLEEKLKLSDDDRLKTARQALSTQVKVNSF